MTRSWVNIRILYRVAQKSKPKVLSISFASYWPFSEFFHCILWKNCSKVVTKRTTTP